LLGDNQARESPGRAELALDQGGRFLALRWTGLTNAGAYIEGAGAIPLLFSLKARLDGLYDIPAVSVTRQPGPHQHRADRCSLSRRRPPRGGLHSWSGLVDQAARES